MKLLPLRFFKFYFDESSPQLSRACHISRIGMDNSVLQTRHLLLFFFWGGGGGGGEFFFLLLKTKLTSILPPYMLGGWGSSLKVAFPLQMSLENALPHSTMACNASYFQKLQGCKTVL